MMQHSSAMTIWNCLISSDFCVVPENNKLLGGKTMETDSFEPWLEWTALSVFTGRPLAVRILKSEIPVCDQNMFYNFFWIRWMQKKLTCSWYFGILFIQNLSARDQATCKTRMSPHPHKIMLKWCCSYLELQEQQQKVDPVEKKTVSFWTKHPWMGPWLVKFCVCDAWGMPCYCGGIIRTLKGNLSRKKWHSKSGWANSPSWFVFQELLPIW